MSLSEGSGGSGSGGGAESSSRPPLRKPSAAMRSKHHLIGPPPPSCSQHLSTRAAELFFKFVSGSRRKMEATLFNVVVNDLADAPKSIVTFPVMMDGDFQANCVNHVRNLLRVKHGIGMVKVLFVKENCECPHQ